MEAGCYCNSVDPDQKSYMLICGECKKHFHLECLEMSKLSPLAGDIFYNFKCRSCGPDGSEEFDRMKMQWLQVVMLALYNLQLSGSGKCGYFRWKEHICAFIDKYWALLFAAHRKKTSLWHGTVAGTLSTGCPGYFLSGASVLGESGWWKLTVMKPPVYRIESAVRPRKKAEVAPPVDQSTIVKVEGLRSRRGKSSIQAAIELKVKRSTLMEAKDIRKAQTASKPPEPAASEPPGVSSSTSTDAAVVASASATTSYTPPEDSRLFPSSAAPDTDFKRKPIPSKAQSIPSFVVKQEPVEEEEQEYAIDEVKAMVRGTKEEAPDSESSLVSESFQVSEGFEHLADADENSIFSLPGARADMDVKPLALTDMFLSADSDSDLEIDPGTLSPPAGMSSASFRESPSLQDILSSIDDNSRVSEDSLMSRTQTDIIKSEPMTPADSDTEVGGNREESDSEDIQNYKKRKLEEVEKKIEEPPPPKFSPISQYEEFQILKKLNMAAEKMKLEPELNRLRRKLIVRQLKRERGLPIFDLDLEMKKIEEKETGILKDSYGLNFNLRDQPIFRGDNLRILDRFQCGHLRSQAMTQQFPSFLHRLIGQEDNQLQSIKSPYTSRVLKPFIRRDRESKPLRMRLLEEIIAYPHRNDPTWQSPTSHPIDYCYVRPQHIPSVNFICREFFWPGIDLSECLQYPDFSCVVLYRRVVIGFAFMVPDVKYNEAYISFIFTHPEWRRAGIATFMLYHLIQTCMGKDVTLHVSATNNAMLLYQKFGFKVEELILDFYDKYYAVDSRDCKHAYFLRLRR